jgi:hypothetical protein
MFPHNQRAARLIGSTSPTFSAYRLSRSTITAMTRRGVRNWLLQDFCCWHKCEVPAALGKVRFQGQPGRHLRTLSSSQFDSKLPRQPPVGASFTRVRPLYSAPFTIPVF